MKDISMTKMLAQRILTVILFLNVFLSFCFAGDWCKDDGRLQISRDITKSTGYDDVFLSRREDLETVIQDLQYLSSSPDLPPGSSIQIRCIQVFDAKREGYSIEDGRITQAKAVMDDSSLFRVAFDRNTNAIFHLAGFMDSREGFNGLIGVLRIRAESEEMINVVRSAYISLNYQDSGRVVVRNELDLMGAVIRERRSRVNKPELLAKWNKIPLSIRQQSSPPTIAKIQSGYRVAFYILEDLLFSRITIVISKDGNVLSENADKIFTMPF